MPSAAVVEDVVVDVEIVDVIVAAKIGLGQHKDLAAIFDDVVAHCYVVSVKPLDAVPMGIAVVIVVDVGVFHEKVISSSLNAVFSHLIGSGVADLHIAHG